MVTIQNIKMTDKKYRELYDAFQMHNKKMKRTNNLSLAFSSFDDYVLYSYGKKKVKSNFNNLKTFLSSKPKRINQSSAVEIDKPNSNYAAGTKVESEQYTGDFVVGLATMHKSNTTPVTKNTDPTIFAKMRR